MTGDSKRVWIVGAKGHVGSALTKLLDRTQHYKLLETDIEDVDVTDRESVSSFMRINRPEVVINCSGLSDVEECEKNPDKAYSVNAIGARNLAMEAEVWESKLIQLSTDDVFGGDERKEHIEFERAEPRSVYGKSKYAGEQLVSTLSNKYVIIRSSWVYGIGRDYVNLVLDAAEKKEKFEAPINQFSSPTSATELAKVIMKFIENDLYGIYHVAGKGFCSRYEFAKAILEFSGKSQDVDLIPVEEKDGIRPCYSVLDGMMLRLDQIKEPKDWKEALREYIEETGGNI